MAVLVITRIVPDGKTECAIQTSSILWMQPSIIGHTNSNATIKMVDGSIVDTDDAYDGLRNEWRGVEKDS